MQKPLQYTVLCIYLVPEPELTVRVSVALPLRILAHARRGITKMTSTMTLKFVPLPGELRLDRQTGSAFALICIVRPWHREHNRRIALPVRYVDSGVGIHQLRGRHRSSEISGLIGMSRYE